MGEQRELHPTPRGLSRDQVLRLTAMANSADGASMVDLLSRVDAHMDQARHAHARSRLVNIRFAEAIHNAFRTIVEEWERIPVEAHYWLRGAMRYFVSSDDDEDDFTSAIGFEDDAEVLNACLCLAGRYDLCLTPEDYDDV